MWTIMNQKQKVPVDNIEEDKEELMPLSKKIESI